MAKITGSIHSMRLKKKIFGTGETFMITKNEKYIKFDFLDLSEPLYGMRIKNGEPKSFYIDFITGIGSDFRLVASLVLTHINFNIQMEVN